MPVSRLFPAIKVCNAERLVTTAQLVQRFCPTSSIDNPFPCKKSADRLVKLVRKFHEAAGFRLRLSDWSCDAAESAEWLVTRLPRRLMLVRCASGVKGDKSAMALSATLTEVKED